MKNKKAYMSIILVMIFFHYSCLDNDKKRRGIYLKMIVENTIGSELKLPKKLRLYKPFPNSYILDSLSIYSSDYKIYSLIDASCGTCITKVKTWDKLADEYKKYGVAVILIFNSNDEFELLQYFCESGIIDNFPYPFLFDVNNEYAGLNKFMKENEDMKTVLTDKENNILLLGNPLKSEEIKQLFLNEILDKTQRK